MTQPIPAPARNDASVLCDLILPVHNGLTYVKNCLNSILECSAESDYRLYIVDDASDHHTSRFLQRQARTHSHISFYRNETNLGFLRSCNFGIAQGVAPYVILINSDIIVTPNWLTRLVRCAESDPHIAAVNPLTNSAPHIEIPLAPGANFYGMDRLIGQHASRQYPDVVTGVGFCMLLRRAALAEVGVFDEVYGHGYCEDSDLCMRLVANGYRTVVADDVYVYHKGGASFPDRDTRYRSNRQTFDARWAHAYWPQFRVFRAADPLRHTREFFQLRQRWDLEPALRETYRQVRKQWRQGAWGRGMRETLRGVRRLSAAKRDVVTPEAVARWTRPGRLRVSYVLPALTVAGGVLSVIRLVNELILLGVEARIVALREYQEVNDWQLLTRPIIFKTPAELVQHFPPSDIAVATHWDTAAWVAEAMQLERAQVGVYFLQDYESWFFSEEEIAMRAKVKHTYTLLSHKLVTSGWLQGLLKQDGFSAHKIAPGIDLAMFYPRQASPPARMTLMAMARPRTPRRGFATVIETLRLVQEAMPEVHIVLFGDDLSSHQIPFPHEDLGIVTNPNQLAERYSTVDVFLDGSDFQGFGYPAIEAMACGAACVLTHVGGVSEYARNEQNCLLVPPKQPALCADAIVRILAHRDLKQHLQEGGSKTVRAYCHKREARETLRYFQRLITAPSPALHNQSSAPL